MERWGLWTWFGVLLLVALALIYFAGFTSDVGALSNAFGNTAKNILVPTGTTPQYA